MGRLSTHVLDTARGVPAGQLAVDLFRVDLVRAGEPMNSAVTSEQGRIEFLSGQDLETGIYELLFHAGDYFRASGVALADPPFLDEITIRFGIADPRGNYHVPLLLSPYAYSTYRGS